MALDINGYSSVFKTFVDFAQPSISRTPRLSSTAILRSKKDCSIPTNRFPSNPA